MRHLEYCICERRASGTEYFPPHWVVCDDNGGPVKNFAAAEAFAGFKTTLFSGSKVTEGTLIGGWLSSLFARSAKAGSPGA
jgi:predicted oxidoreductase